MAHQSVYVCLVGILASFVVAVNAGPVTTEPVSSSVSDDTFSSAVPYEFPDDYSISLEQAVVTRKEFVSAALLNMVTEMVTEIAEGKKAREEMMEAIEELRGRLKQQEENNQIPQDSASRWNKIQSRRSESKEKRPRSCHDLKQAGHSLSGFYLVRGSQRLEIVFCPFSSDLEDDGSLFLEETVDVVAV